MVTGRSEPCGPGGTPDAGKARAAIGQGDTRLQTRRTPGDWGLFLLLSGMWTSAFALTRVAVADLPADFVVACRLTVAAMILNLVLVIRGERMPALSDRRAWATMAVMGLVGTLSPFLVISMGQKTINSSLAALYVAAAPLFVAAMAHLRFADERMPLSKAVGILVGFSGVAVLLGPDALSGEGTGALGAQLLCLTGAACYAINTIIARGAPALSPVVLPTGFLSFAALGAWPVALAGGLDTRMPGPGEWAAILALGAIPSAAAGILLMYLVRRTTATFISLTGYAIPILAAFVGHVAFGETQGWNASLAFLLILSGIWLTRRADLRAVVPARGLG